MLDRGEVKTQTALARKVGVTHARISQLLRFLKLAPAIQESYGDGEG